MIFTPAIFIEPEFIRILFCLTMDNRISPDFYMVLTENANFNNFGRQNFELNINVVKKYIYTEA